MTLYFALSEIVQVKKILVSQTDLVIDLAGLGAVCQGAVQRAGRADVIHLARVFGPRYRFGRERGASLLEEWGYCEIKYVLVQSKGY